MKYVPFTRKYEWRQNYWAQEQEPEVDPPPLYDGIGVGIPMPIGTYATRKTTQQQISSKRTLDSHTPITK